MPGGGVRIHYVVPLVIAYIVARSALADLVNATETVEYEVTTGRPSPHVVPLEEHVAHAHAAEHVAHHPHEMPENASSSDSGYHDPLFGPHDPNRVYTHKEKKYFQVGVIDFERVRTPFVIGSWILAASLAKIGFHMFPKLSHMFPESCLLIVIGIIVGVILYFGGLGDVEAAHHLDPDTFFLFMLPPIILDAGYFMPNRLFFDNLGTILLFAVVGTIFNTFTIGGGLYLVGLTGLYGVEMPILNTFLFAALISAVDPVAVLAVFEEIHVNEMLYIVVFGESLLNDAVTVVLYHMFEAYVEMGPLNITALDVAAGLLKFLIVSLGGTLVGIIWGFLTAFVTRFTSSVRVIEPLFVFIMSYLAYLNAEIFHLSGILAITFCGLTMKNYVISNVSAKSHTTIKYTMKMLSSSCETVIFMLLGVATVHNHHIWNTYFVLFTILFCSLFRALGVLILAGLANRARMHKIEGVEKFVMMYGGLRGAVAFALVLLIDPHHVPQQQMFLTTTITVVYFTVFVQGMTIKPLVEKLGVKRANKRKLTMNERIHERSLDHIMAGIEDIVGHPGRYYLRDMFKHLNHKYLRPLLTHEDTTRDPKIMETFSKLALKDAMKSAVDDVINGGQKSARMRNSPSWGDIIRDNSNWNLSRMDGTYMPDMNEIRYNPSMKDLNDATIHHLLDSDQNNPRQRRRRWSYSRHAVCDEDMHTRPVNHTMQVYMKQRMIDMYRRKKQRNQNGSPRKNVSFAVQTNGSTVKLKDDDLYDVIDSVPMGRETRVGSSPPKDADDPDDILSFDAPDGTRPDSALSDVSDHITTTESVLPWKRDDEVLVCQRPLKWHNTSAPAWIANEDYTHYASPPESMTVVEPEPAKAADAEEGLRPRRSSLTSSFRAGLRSLRSSLRRQLGGSPPPPVSHEPSAILEDGEVTVVTAEEVVQAAVEAAAVVAAEEKEAAAKAAKAAKAAAKAEEGKAEAKAGGETATTTAGTEGQTASKPASLDEPAEEGGRRNFTAVSIDQCEEEKSRTRL